MTFLLAKRTRCLSLCHGQEESLGESFPTQKSIGLKGAIVFITNGTSMFDLL